MDVFVEAFFGCVGRRGRDVDYATAGGYAIDRGYTVGVVHREEVDRDTSGGKITEHLL